ncbi:tetratricopeptide repeat (TPR)-like superfamily protein [Tasmannia lanceolata]|uniref:tetratricopeptide repeat (TPR)-like superfamily protein n=1 Tax=Tasmannia lanceolata TaxID=3420 RepID=UPI004062BDFD
MRSRFLLLFSWGNPINVNMVFPIRPCIRKLFTGSRPSCIDYRDHLKTSKDLLTEKIQLGTNVGPFETNTLMKELIKTGNLSDARYLFDKMPQRDEISWTTIIGGYVNSSNASEALSLFWLMWVDTTIRMDPFILSLALKACGCNLALKQGECIHGYSVKSGFVNSIFVGSALLDMYTKAGSISTARRVFAEMPLRNVVSWTAIITGLVRAGQSKEALEYFSEMWGSDVECDSYTFATVLKACADLCALNYGKAIHTQAMKFGFDSSSFVANTLAAVYNRCGKLDYGLRLFERMRSRDVVSWTTIIATYVQMGREEHGVQAFVQMRESGVSPNEFTFAAIISGCAGLAKIEWGKQLHACVLCLGLLGFMSVSNAVMTMYSKCGCLDSAAMVFRDMPRRDLVSWSAIISGYSQEGQCEEAFELLSQMRKEGTKPNEFTLASLLSVCAYMAILEQGRQVHAHIHSVGLEQDAMINSALINMYSKCGSIEEASQIFDTMQNEDTVSWTAMLNGYAEHGYSKEAIDLFEKMPKVGLRADYVTFIGVLSACSHAGLVDLGFHYFNSMTSDYQINPGREHYGCMVDLLCRSGRLSDAESMIKSMPFKPDDVVWSTLLRSSRVHGNTECGKRSADQILELQPNCAGTHITLSNIYAATGRWRDAAGVRKLMKSKGVIKEPGWSWIEVKERVSAFVAGDRSHPEGEEICTMLGLLASRAKMDGYVP